MSIEEHASHLYNLTALLDFYERIGAERNKWVVREFDRCNVAFINALKEKHK